MSSSKDSPKSISRATDQSDDLQAERPTKLVKTHEMAFPEFPVGISSYLAINSNPKAFYVDKTMFIPALERLGEAVILLAPKGFGKSLLLDTLACYYDIARAETFEEDFGKRWIGQVDQFDVPRKTPLASQWLVMRFDFSHISLADFESDVNDIINYAIISFCDTYKVLTPTKDPTGASLPLSPNAVQSFRILMREVVHAQRKKVMILIDEYDTFLNAVLGHKELLDGLEQKIIRFKTFFASIKSKLGPYLRVFIAGVAPMVLSMYSSGFDVGQITLQDDMCCNLFGFTETDVGNGLGMLSLSSYAHSSVLAILKELHNGYRFHRDSPNTLYNPTRVHFFLSKLADFIQQDPNRSLQDLEGLVRATSDPNTKPAHPVLQEPLSKNPLAFDILTQCINNPNGFPSNLFEIDYQIFPSSLAEVDRQPLPVILSWLFFQGALTYAKQFAPGDHLSFAIPNAVAMAELVQNLQLNHPSYLNSQR